MIIQSMLEVDRKDGTVDLACAVTRTAGGQTIGYDNVLRMLVWHCPQQEQYLQVAAVLRGLRDRYRARQLRVVGITPNLFALGLYPKDRDPGGNPAAIALLELDSEGTVLRAERWGTDQGSLSLIFDAHKDDTHPEGWLESVAQCWRRVSMTKPLPRAQTPAEIQTDFQAALRYALYRGDRPAAAKAATKGSRRERGRVKQQVRQT